MANPRIIAGKKAKVEQLAKRIKESKLVLLANYRGINVEQDTELRSEVRKVGGEYSVIKNNIIKRAFEECGIKGLEEHFEGPIAIITAKEDYLSPSKAIYNFAKNNKFYELKVGIIEGEIKTSEEILIIAQLPSREELIAKLAGVLKANISKLAVALNAVKEKKESAEPASKEEVKEEKKEEVKEETKTETKDEEKQPEKTEEKQEETAEVKPEEKQEEKPEEKTEEEKKEKSE